MRAAKRTLLQHVPDERVHGERNVAVRGGKGPGSESGINAGVFPEGTSVTTGGSLQARGGRNDSGRQVGLPQERFFPGGGRVISPEGGLRAWTPREAYRNI